MFSKILIANRGEIAVRVIRSCMEMGIETVAIYSEADRSAPHVLKATEAYSVGPPPSTESYLNTDKILDILQKSGADSVHPGYGFLSENCEFADAVQKTGAAWIGPSGEAITTMGDKLAARELAQKVGAPIVPGSPEPINDHRAASKTAEEIGFPVLVKAAGGGGGKGMRMVNSTDELKNAIQRTRSEAKKSFADDRVYIEKFLEEPHHIEIQVFADDHGNAVSMGERECSIQRRYQKIIEETPSPFITDKLRRLLTETALKITRSCEYSGAGTVEFLVDKHQNFYFLEMNTRLQVEHPITEMVTGIDLVRTQIITAAGDPLPFTQKDIKPRGHAIECRIYAEDGSNDFAPSTGTITNMILPQGLGVRLDEGVLDGQEITPYYDPLLAKLITWGTDRETALQRMKRALSEFHIAGIETSIPFCLSILQHKTFEEGQYNTHTLESIKKELISNLKIQQQDGIITAAIGAVHRSLEKVTDNSSIENTPSTWKTHGKEDNLQ